MVMFQSALLFSLVENYDYLRAAIFYALLFWFIRSSYRSYKRRKGLKVENEEVSSDTDIDSDSVSES